MLITANSNYVNLFSSLASTRRAAQSTTATDAMVLEKTPEVATMSNQTIDEVKEEFYSYLDSLTISPGLSSTSISIRISDSAFEKMLADPEYKQKMKDLCARDLCDPQWVKIAAMRGAPSATVITINADADEEYLASSFGAESDRKRASGDNFWERRAERNKELLQEREARQQAKYLEERWITRFFETQARTIPLIINTPN